MRFLKNDVCVGVGVGDGGDGNGDGKTDQTLVVPTRSPAPKDPGTTTKRDFI